MARPFCQNRTDEHRAAPTLKTWYASAAKNDSGVFHPSSEDEQCKYGYLKCEGKVIAQLQSRVKTNSCQTQFFFHGPQSHGEFRKTSVT